MLEITREKFNSLKRHGYAGTVKGAYWMIMLDSQGITILTPVKITRQIAYKKTGKGSFSPVKIQGL